MSRPAGDGLDEVVTRGDRDRGGHEGHQDGVDARMPHDPVHAVTELFLRDSGCGVHGVADGGPLGQHREQVVDEFRGGRRQGEPGLRAGVGAEHTGAARVGDDRHPGSRRKRLGVQQGCRFEEFADRVGRGDAGLSEQGLAGHGAGGGRRGVRGGGAAPRVGATGVDGEHRNAPGHPAGGTGEGTRVAEGLQVQQGEVGGAVGLPPLEHVVAADVVLVTERDERGHADAQPGQAVEQGDADPAGLDGHSGGAGARGVRGEGRVEAQQGVGVGDAQAVGPDHAHAVGAAGCPKGVRLLGVEPGGDDEQSPYARLSALLRGRRHGRGGYGDHHEVGSHGQRADARVGRHAEDRGGRRVHRPQPSGVGTRLHLVQDRAAHRPGRASRADHGDRRRPQQGPQALHVGGAAALLHCRQVVVVLVEGDRAAHFGPFEAAGRAQTEVGEEAQHFMVLAQGVGGEGGDTVRAGRGHQVLEQEGAHAPVVQSVGDGDGDLGLGAAVAGLVLGETDHLAVPLGQQGTVAGTRWGTGPVGRHLCGPPARREEPQTQVLRGHLLVQALQLLVVARQGGADAHGGAVREQGVGPGTAERVVLHRGSPQVSVHFERPAGRDRGPWADRG
ncbi:hypothetical protein M2162_001076 [Streptomyces sp. SAI-041]|nr:hypothetical protein [Streptomyces sp. SAI-041]